MKARASARPRRHVAKAANGDVKDAAVRCLDCWAAVGAGHEKWCRGRTPDRIIVDLRAALRRTHTKSARRRRALRQLNRSVNYYSLAAREITRTNARMAEVAARYVAPTPTRRTRGERALSFGLGLIVGAALAAVGL